MSAQPGRNALIKIGATIVAGFRLKRIRLQQRGIDATDVESQSQWRELIASAGVKSARIEGFGTFRDSAGEEAVRSAFFAGTTPTMTFVLPSWGEISGAFLIVDLDFSGEVQGEVETRMAFESAGALTWSAL